MFKKFIAAVATVVLTLGVSVVGVSLPAVATVGYPTGEDANKPAKWQLLVDETCIKIEPVRVVPYVLPAPPAGRTYSKIVVKAGSDESVDEPNTVVLNPIPGQGYKHDEKNSISHIILCTVPVPFDTPKDATGTISFTPPTCDADGSYTLSGAVNATFTVSDGTTTTTGLGNTSATPAVTGKTYTITVVPGIGHSLTDATKASDSFKYTAAINCRLEVALYVYKKLDPSAPASWSNSGKQTLITSKVGNTWYTSDSFPTLPSWVCGPAWGVQQDMSRDWAASWDVDNDGRFDWPMHIQYPDDNIGWPPLYDAKHTDLDKFITVPPCETTSGEPTYESKSCAVDSKNSVTLPAVPGGQWTLTNGAVTKTFSSYDGDLATTDPYGDWVITLVDIDANDQYTVTPKQTSWTWPRVDPASLKCAYAQDPTWSDQKCNPTGPGTTDASYTIYKVTGIRYEVSINDGAFTPVVLPENSNTGVFPVTTFPTKVVITAYPEAGYELVGTSQSDHRFTAEVDCIDKDAEAFIEAVPASCAAAGKINLATRTITNAMWTTPMPTAPGTYDVIATADAGHAFANGDLTKTFPITLAAQIPDSSPSCDLPVLGLSVPTYTVTQPTCSTQGSYTVGASINAQYVEWRVQGSSSIIPFNTKVEANAGTTVTLVATSTDPINHGLQAPNGSDWVNPIVLTFVSVDEKNCDLQLTTLALTGLGASLGIPLAGGLIFLGIGGLLMFARMRREV